MSKSLNFSVQKIDITEENDKSFLGVKLWAISEGKNRNKVDFTQESIDKCSPTVLNKPILAAFDKNQEEFLGHNDLGEKIDEDTNEIYTDYDSGLLDKIAEKPIGMIPLDSKINTKEEYKKKNWLTITGLIWTKYNHNLVKLLKEIKTEKVSVEVTLTDYEEKDGVIVVHEFIFDGVTIIGVPEGIEGANVKVGNFAQSDLFNKYQKAFVFARQKENDVDNNDNDVGGKDDIRKMVFDFKGMSLNTFRNKIDFVLSEIRFRPKDCDWDHHKYFVYDILPDENKIILEDLENQKLVKLPFSIGNDRNIIIEFDKLEEVEIAYAEVSFGKKVDFSFRENDGKENKNTKEEGEVLMDVKFKEKFVEKGYNPIYKFDKFVLFTKANEKNEVEICKLEFELIDKCEEGKVDELFAQFTSLEEKPKEEMVAKTEFEKIVAEKEQLSKDVELEKQKCSEGETKLTQEVEKCAKFEKELTSVKQELETTKTELTNVKQEFAKLSKEKFKAKVVKDIEDFKQNFGEEFDMFRTKVFDLMEKDEIVNDEQFESYTSKQLFDYTKRLNQNKPKQFGLTNGKDDITVKKDSIKDRI